MKLYSYVVDHDTGYAPNPYFGVCTLCRCKYRKCCKKPKNVVELAEKGDWVVGTGGTKRHKSAGHGKLVYAMRVDKKLTREEYYNDSRFAAKRRVMTGTSKQTRGDNEPPRDGFERSEQFVLVSRHFYYFGANAKPIPDEFPDLEKRGPGFKSRCFSAEYVRRFVDWLESEYKLGKQGEPCQKHTEKPRRSRICRSSC